MSSGRRGVPVRVELRSLRNPSPRRGDACTGRAWGLGAHWGREGKVERDAREGRQRDGSGRRRLQLMAGTWATFGPRQQRRWVRRWVVLHGSEVLRTFRPHSAHSEHRLATDFCRDQWYHHFHFKRVSTAVKANDLEIRVDRTCQRSSHRVVRFGYAPARRQGWFQIGGYLFRYNV